MSLDEARTALPPDVAMTDAEAAAVVDLFRDELTRGWIPKRADLEAALDLVRNDLQA